MKLRAYIIITLCLLLSSSALLLLHKVELVRIQDNSMYPTLDSGDLIATWKTGSNVCETLKDRIIVFYFPLGNYGDKIYKSQDIVYIQRCTGCPGDTATVSGRTVVLPYKGYRIKANDSTCKLYEKVMVYETEQYGKTICNDSLFTFSENYYYAIGDNSSVSFDSRHWGLIPESFIISYK